MRYIIYIPESEPPGTTFSHFGIKGRSGRHKYGSGLYPFQDLRRSGIMNWSINGIDRGAESAVAYAQSDPSISHIFTKEELASNSQEVICRAYLEKYTTSNDYYTSRVQDGKEIVRIAKYMTPDSKLRKEFENELEQIKKLNLLYRSQQGKAIDEETGLHLKDPSKSTEFFRDTYGQMGDGFKMDKHMREMIIDTSKINYKQTFVLPNGRNRNCGICVVAYDMRRRGYDVVAKKGYNFNPFFIYKEPSVKKQVVFMQKTKFDKSTKNDKELWNKVLEERERGYDRVVKEFNTKFPDESRGYVIGVYSYFTKNGKYADNGHTFNFERHNGRTYIIDPQVNLIYDIESELGKKYLMDFDSYDAIRTDDIEPYAKDLLKNILE